MKELTKEDILKIVKESNKGSLEEYFPSDGDQQTKARKETLERYQGFISSAKNFMDQIIQKAKGDYENGIINDADVDFLIDDQLSRFRQSIDYVQASLEAIKGPGIKPSDSGPVYPTSRYEE
tara:strand:+ start:4384 stop:4749 length:366 start_codon:yes stop_codon:yes gene_type:complete